MMIVLRHRPRPLPFPSSSWSSSSSSVVLPQAIGWGGLRELHVAICKGCVRSFASSDAAEVDGWADAHNCGEHGARPDEIPGRAA
ncbi:hypothetical protein ACQPZP_06670 [Spirillospora sp. CA-142024]|uniref:hypothetical protein n=1 Tax=Spirillospora sp. CA-142024 TaxID=3240036 RepID=UPI003D90CA14